MCKKITVKGVLLAVSLASLMCAMFLLTTFEAYADQGSSPISGRLGASYDNKTGSVTAMVAGYCEGRVVTVGPVTWAVAEWEFSNLKAEDVAKKVCEGNYMLKKMTKSANNGKEIVADVLIVRAK